MQTSSQIAVLVLGYHSKSVEALQTLIRTRIGSPETAFVVADDHTQAQVCLIVDDIVSPTAQPQSELSRALGLLPPIDDANYITPCIIARFPEAHKTNGNRLPDLNLVSEVDLLSSPAILFKRLCLLARSYPRGIPASVVADWLAGNLRHLLQLAEAHNPANATQAAITRARTKLGHTNTSAEHRLLTELRARTRSFCAQGVSSIGCRLLCPMSVLLAQIPDPLNVAFLSELEEALPRRTGADFLFRHLVRPKALVFDDEIAEGGDSPLQVLARTPLGFGANHLGEFIDFYGLRISSDEPGGLEKFLRGEEVPFWTPSREMPTTRAIPVNAFDFFLVDLFFGGKSERSPFGYHVSWQLKRVCPSTPIIISSAFGQTSQVIRGIRQGADWYCQKGHAAKLGAHLEEQVINPVWSPDEVDTEVAFVDCDAPPLMTPSLRYLYWKLLRDLPGEKICVEPIGDGAGGALTARVEKEIGKNRQRIAPVVCKISDPAQMRLEEQRYIRFILPYIGNGTGRIDYSFVQADARHAAIGYTFAGRGAADAHGHPRSLVNYASFISRELDKSDFSPALSQRLREPIDLLLTEILPKIHSIKPGWDRYFPYPNALFDEFEDPAANHVLRLLPTCEIEVTQCSEPNFGAHVPEHDWEAGDSIYLPDACIAKAYYTEDGQSRTAKLKLLQSVMPSRGRPQYCRFDAVRISDDIVLSTSRIRQLARVSLRGKVTKTSQTLWNELSNSFCAGPSGAIGHFTALKEAFERFLAHIRSTAPCIGIVHGDLQFQNILLDETHSSSNSPDFDPKPWLIDFGRTRRDDIAHDFVIMEECVLTKLLHSKYFTACSGDKTEALIDFLQCWLVQPAVEPRCVKEDNNGRLAFVYHLLVRIRSAASKARDIGDDGPPDKDSRYLSYLGLYLLWLLKDLPEKMKDSAKRAEDHLFISLMCRQAIGIIYAELA